MIQKTLLLPDNTGGNALASLRFERFVSSEENIGLLTCTNGIFLLSTLIYILFYTGASDLTVFQVSRVITTQ